MTAISLLLGLFASSVGLHSTVNFHDGNIFYTNGGATRAMTRDGKNGDPTLAPDGRTVAYIHVDAESPDGSGEKTSLWIADGQTGQHRKLVTPRTSQDPKHNLATFEHPLFSLDGGFVYVNAGAWATSTAVHQVNVATGRERFVTDGGLIGVIRNGPYRGFLLVGQHRYHPAPRLGSYNPVSVIRPDGKQMLVVPGSDQDDGERSVPAWLGKNRWTID